MIKLFLGNIGSGKTACAVREMCRNQRITYSNIETKTIKNNILFSPDMIFKKDVIGRKKTGEKIIKLSLNEEFWQSKNNVNVIIDEAHEILNSRNAFSVKTRIILQFISMLRRVVGSKDDEYGSLIVISQLSRRLDVVLRDMSTEISYFICKFVSRCSKCGFHVSQTNENPEIVYLCPRCKKSLKRCNFVIEVYKFAKIEAFEAWKEAGMKRYYRHYEIYDIENYFPKYNTYQWGNILSKV